MDFANKRIYLSGPMTGMHDWNRETFIEAARYLRNHGARVFNPAFDAPSKKEKAKSHSFYMLRDLHELTSYVDDEPFYDALDVRLVDDTTAAALASVKQAKSIHFAWDGHSQDEAVPRCIRILNKHGIKPWRLMFYVLVGFTNDRDYDMHRIMAIHNMGANPFVMPFDKSDQYQKHLARWCNNKFIFKKVSFDRYEPWTKYRKERKQ